MAEGEAGIDPGMGLGASETSRIKGAVATGGVAICMSASKLSDRKATERS